MTVPTKVARGLALLVLVASGGVARAQATQTGSPPRQDPAVERARAEERSQTAPYTETVDAEALEKPKAEAAAQRDDASRARYRRAQDGEGAPR